MGLSLGIFTRNASTLSLASSGAGAFSFTNTSNNSLSLMSGMRAMTVPININATPGDYFIGLMFTTASAGNGNLATFNHIGAQASAYGGYFGALGSSSNNTYQLIPGFGSVSTAGFPSSSLAFSTLTGTGNAKLIRMNFVNYTV